MKNILMATVLFTFSIFAFSQNKMESGNLKNTSDNKKYPEITIKQSGFENNTEFGLLIGVGTINSYSYYGTTVQNDITAFSFSTVNGWLINPNVFVGIGIGIEKWSLDYRLPLYLNTKFYILTKKVTPFLFTDIGYTWGWNKGYQGSDWAGLMISAGLGAAFHITSSTSVFISISYKIQQVKLEWDRPSFDPFFHIIPEHENSFSNFIVFKTGIGF